METETEALGRLIRKHLRPFVKRIDAEAYYPDSYLREVGRSGRLSSQGKTEREVRVSDVRLIERTAEACMTTGFNFWCHLAAATYLRHTANRYLRETVLPQLEGGELLGGTGLSNPLKFYAGLDTLYLQAEPADGGYRIRGKLPMVSNLGEKHGFGVIASLNEEERIMAFVPCTADGLTLRERSGYLGLNGSATYACEFDGVFAPQEWIVAERVDSFVEKIRPTFVLYQIPLGLGVGAAAIDSIHKAKDRQGGCNRYLPMQADELAAKLESLRERAYLLAGTDDLAGRWPELLRLRLAVVYFALEAVQADMLHWGSAGYVRDSAPSRRLREAYFLASLTPTVRHLEKLTR